MKIVKHDFVGAITALKFSLDGNVIFVACGEKVYVYDPFSGKLVQSVVVIENGVVHGLDLASYKGRQLIAAFGQKKISLLENSCPDDHSNTGILKKCYTFDDVSDLVWDVRILSESKKCTSSCFPPVAIGFAHNFIEVWDIETMEQTFRLQCQEQCILYSLSFLGRCTEELVIASGTVFQEILLWNTLDSGVPAQRLKGHDGVIFHLEWSSAGRMLASVSDDRTVQLWCNDESINFNDPSDRINHLQKINDRVVRETPSSATNILKKNYNCVFRSWGHSARLWDVKFLSFGLVTTSEDAVCKVWDFNGNCVTSLRGHTGKHAWKTAVHPHLNMVATGGGDSSVKLWNIEEQIYNCNSSSLVQSFALPRLLEKSEISYIRSIVSSNDGLHSFGVSDKGQLWKLNIQNSHWDLLYEAPASTNFFSLSIDMEEKYLLAGDALGHAFLLDLSGNLIVEWQAHMSRIIHTSISINESMVSLFTSSVDGTLKMWNFLPNSLEVQITGFYKCPTRVSVSCVILSRNGNLCCGDGKGNVFLYRKCSGTNINLEKPIEVSFILRNIHNREQVSWMQFKKERLYSAGHDGYINVYNFVENTSLSLSIVQHESVKGLSTIKRFWWNPTDESLIVFGFHASHAILLNLTHDYHVFYVDCGGWRRPHDVVLGPMNRNSIIRHSFVFAPPSTKSGSFINAHSTLAQSSSFDSSTIDEPLVNISVSLHTKFHGKLGTCAVWNEDSNILITGSEDNSLMLREYSNAIELGVLIDSAVAHTTGIRSLAASGGPGGIIVSGGGKQTINIWMMNSDLKCIDHLIEYSPKDAIQDQRILGIASVPVSRESGDYLILSGNTEGTVRAVLVNTKLRTSVDLSSFSFINRPILCCEYLRIKDIHLIVIGYTSGQVFIAEISSLLKLLTLRQDLIIDDIAEWTKNMKPLFDYNAHDLGVNCVSSSQINDSEFLIASGGDDQAVCTAKFEVYIDESIEDKTNIVLTCASIAKSERQSGSALKAIYTDGRILIAAGYDQRLNVWQFDTAWTCLVWQIGAFLECADITTLAVKYSKLKEEYIIAAVGQGIQLATLSMN